MPMSTADILSTISIIAFVIAAISSVLAVFLWFRFKIPAVIGDLSGHTAKKSVARMRANNEKAGGQGYKPSATNLGRGKLTDTMQHSRKLKADSKKKSTENIQKKKVAENLMPETGILETNKAVITDNQQTEILTEGEATAVLTEEAVTVSLRQEHTISVKHSGRKKLKMLDEKILIHTDEVIR